MVIAGIPTVIPAINLLKVPISRTVKPAGKPKMVLAAAPSVVFPGKDGFSSPIETRIGIPAGPVVARIVGINKFAYDIWGDTVNIASRVESSSESGRINISGIKFDLVKDKFSCTYHGKIQAKNKGMIDMYFVNGPA